MKNKIYLKSSMVLVVTLGLTACNGGGSTTTSSSAPQTSELQQYINSLAFTPAGGKGLTAGGTRQQSFTTLLLTQSTLNFIVVQIVQGL